MSAKTSASSHERALASAEAIGEAVLSVLDHDVVLIVGIKDGHMKINLFGSDVEAEATAAYVIERIARALGSDGPLDGQTHP
jgi:molybdopterin-guanine dinucleotide biosynthesis protein